MAKKSIHPEIHHFPVVISGDSFDMRSTYKCDKYIVDIDYRKHPAWVGGGISGASEGNKSVSDFNRKFGSLNFTSKK